MIIDGTFNRDEGACSVLIEDIEECKCSQTAGMKYTFSIHSVYSVYFLQCGTEGKFWDVHSLK